MTDSLSHLPVNPLPQVPRHTFGADRFVKRDPAKGREHDQTERACPCGVVKITVFAPTGARREWRLPGSPDQYSDAIRLDAWRSEADAIRALMALQLYSTFEIMAYIEAAIYEAQQQTVAKLMSDKPGYAPKVKR